jgi:hypothetical protein
MQYILGTIDGTAHELDQNAFVAIRQWLQPEPPPGGEILHRPSDATERKWFDLEDGGKLLVIASAVAYMHMRA